MVIALMRSCAALHPTIGLRMSVNPAVVVVSRHPAPGSASIVLALTSPRPLTAVCG
jgi:hypothetical protein